MSRVERHSRAARRWRRIEESRGSPIAQRDLAEI
jgi:hypothetical protein